jgi:hypothetical protein
VTSENHRNTKGRNKFLRAGVRTRYTADLSVHR